ncbi:formate dehydrogenase accessory sulfurtransferase FdhD [Propionispira arboris]
MSIKLNYQDDLKTPYFGLAKDLGITIIGHVRNDSFYIYTHPERVVFL